MNVACQGAFLLFSTVYWWNQRSLDDLNLPFSHDVETISKISWCVAITFAPNMCAAVAFDIRSWNPFKRQFLNIIFLQKKQFWKDGKRWFDVWKMFSSVGWCQSLLKIDTGFGTFKWQWLSYYAASLRVSYTNNFSLLSNDTLSQILRNKVIVIKNKETILIKWAIPGLFCLFSSFSHHSSSIKWKKRTSCPRESSPGRKMVSADGSTELHFKIGFSRFPLLQAL